MGGREGDNWPMAYAKGEWMAFGYGLGSGGRGEGRIDIPKSRAVARSKAF
jgi:hypothetical protein